MHYIHMYIHVPPVNIMMVLFCLASHNPLSLNHTARYSQLGLGTRLHNDAMFSPVVWQIFFHPMLRLNLISEEDHCKIFGNIQTILTLHEGTCKYTGTKPHRYIQ